jgi:GntR family transcriptional repressor for pyruvate dehydrogenase complex
MAQHFRKITSGRAFEVLIGEVTSALEEGRLQPGERLPSEPELAAQFGVSRSVLREALKALELNGYLRVRRGYGGGTFVAEVVPDEFATVRPPAVPTDGVTARHLHQVRVAFEPYAARLAAGRLLLPERGIFRAGKHFLLDDERPAHLLAAIADFHVAVAQASENPVFVAVIEGLRPVMYRALKDAVLDDEWRRRCEKEHEHIASCIEAGDAAAAEEAMRTHLATDLRG